MHMDMDEKIKHAWEISAEGYSKRVVVGDFKSPGKDIWTKLILEKAPRDGELKILDVGTGPGVFASILAAAGHDTTGIDISPKMLEEARANAASIGVSPTFIEMDSQHIDFPDNTFDMIISRNVMWIIQKPEEVYATWLRILKPGGVVIVFDYAHGKEGFASQTSEGFKKNVEEYKEKNGEEPMMSFPVDKFEEARGWKKEVPLSHVERPQWDVDTMNRLGYEHVEWDDVKEYLKYKNVKADIVGNEDAFFRLCGTKPDIN